MHQKPCIVKTKNICIKIPFFLKFNEYIFDKRNTNRNAHMYKFQKTKLISNLISLGNSDDKNRYQIKSTWKSYSKIFPVKVLDKYVCICTNVGKIGNACNGNTMPIFIEYFNRYKRLISISLSKDNSRLQLLGSEKSGTISIISTFIYSRSYAVTTLIIINAYYILGLIIRI